MAVSTKDTITVKNAKGMREDLQRRLAEILDVFTLQTGAQVTGIEISLVVDPNSTAWLPDDSRLYVMRVRAEI